MPLHSMAKHIAEKTIKEMIKVGYVIKGARVLILGITFKENCPDMRNTKVIDIIKELQEYGTTVDVYDPWVDKEEVEKYYRYIVIKNPFEVETKYDAIIVAVGHNKFKSLDITDYKIITKGNLVIIDVKGIVPEATWRL